MRAWVIGNVAIDEIMSVPTMPEAGASIFGQQQSTDLGGKGANQAIVLGRAGLDTTLIAAVGNDLRASMIRQSLSLEPINTRLIELVDKASDISMIFTTPDGENAIVTTTDCATSVRPQHVTSALQAAKPGDLTILQGNLSDDTTATILHEAKRCGMITAFNPSPLRPSFAALWSLIDIVFLNQGEAEKLTGESGEAAAQCLRDAGVGTVIITLGGKGAILADRTGTTTIPAVPSVAVDTTGAGDTFMAVALASSSLRHVMPDGLALRHAAQAASITVSRRGTRSAFPSQTELAAILTT
ncbi:ribokinase [Agrobacterium vitis]|uniref:ribokinase n=1 Tax=Allorhizobium ampelinum TaxID=3025782 RepID=UPI001F2C6AB3|nr:ribokinase [Allorhizobium ampelinum]MCF1473589.1 ribokinase [Allorhizobium ampelinum]